MTSRNATPSPPAGLPPAPCARRLPVSDIDADIDAAWALTQQRIAAATAAAEAAAQAARAAAEQAATR